VLPVFPTAATTEVEDVDGGPAGGAGRSPAATTTEDEEDVDGGPPVRCCRYFRQRPPPKLKTSMQAPWGMLSVSRADPLGVLSKFSAAATTEFEDVDC
jgi:hypothetical protein